MLSPRPPGCYDPTIAPHRDGDVVHVHDHATVRALLRDAWRVTSDVSELLTPEQREHVHPVSAFVWATDRWTLSGRPGRHAALRGVMAPWFTPAAVAARLVEARPAVEFLAADATARPFDVYHDYALPAAVGYLAGWLGVRDADVRYAVADQLVAGEMFATWPARTPAGMDEHHRALLARPGLGGVAGAARDLLAAGVLGDREAWGIVYSLAVGAVAVATSVTLAVGLAIEHGRWPGMVDDAAARAAVEEAVRLGAPFPQASRFVREPFTLGAVAVEPGDQVLMWLTAANRDLPGPHAQPLDRFDPDRNADHLGWGSGYHRCAGALHARAVAAAAVTALARRRPHLAPAGPWTRFVGIDDGFVAAPACP